MKHHILIVGAGNLGSRHLQSLCEIETPLTIDVVEPHEYSRTIAKARAQEIKEFHLHDLNFFQEIPSRRNYEFAVIATLSNVRFDVLKTIFENQNSIKNVLLEKVLFQSEEQLNLANALLENQNTKAWVNYPRRMFPIYESLQKRLSDQFIEYLEVNGGSWGLACNSIHFLDLFEFLTKSEIKDIDTSDIEPQIAESKRSGFYEFFGSYSGLLANGTSFKIKCSHGNEDLTLAIKTNKGLVTCNETAQTLSYLGEIEKFQFLFQSQMTKHVYSDIIQSGGCKLTKLSNSTMSNQIFLKKFIALQNAILGTSDNKLNIT